MRENACAAFCFNWTSCSGRFLEFVNVFISLFTSLAKMRDPSFEQKQNLFTQRYFVPGLVEIGPVVLEKICEVFKCIFTILYYLLLESGVVLPLNKLGIPLTQGF